MWDWRQGKIFLFEDWFLSLFRTKVYLVYVMFFPEVLHNMMIAVLVIFWNTCIIYNSNLKVFIRTVAPLGCPPPCLWTGGRGVRAGGRTGAATRAVGPPPPPSWATRHSQKLNYRYKGSQEVPCTGVYGKDGPRPRYRGYQEQGSIEQGSQNTVQGVPGTGVHRTGVPEHGKGGPRLLTSDIDYLTRKT